MFQLMTAKVAQGVFHAMSGTVISCLFATLSVGQQIPRTDSRPSIPSIVDTTDKLKEAVVQIHAVGADGTESYATGFLVTDSGLVLTSSNIVSTAKELELTRFDDSSPAKIVFKSSDVDGIALLQSKWRDQNLSIASHEPSPKDQISAVGWEAMTTPRLGSDVGSIVQVNGNKIYYSRSSDTRPGFSGGPLINDRGEVIGIHMGKTFGSNIAWALDLRSQLPILRKFGVLEEHASTMSQALSLEVGCGHVYDRTQTVQFHLEPGQRIADAYALVGEQAHLESAKANIESVSGSEVSVHSLLQGESRGKALGLPGILGLPWGSCPTGHALILVHARIETH